jgi:CheY-like chemotaxis protein
VASPWADKLADLAIFVGRVAGAAGPGKGEVREPVPEVAVGSCYSCRWIEGHMRTSEETRVGERAHSDRSEDSGLHRTGHWTGRARILVIDDEPLLGRTLSFMLEEHHDVVVVEGGAEALRRLGEDARFDLVLCDLDMPGMNGSSVHQAVVDAHPELVGRFVLMTGGACSGWAEEFLARYSGARLEKPFSVADVEQVLGLVG